MALSACPLSLRAFGDKPVIRRVIPSSGQALAVVGLGSWQTVSPSLRSAATNVMERFVDLGGEVVDTSPMYGSAEKVLGEINTSLNISERLFMATKVWTNGSAQGRQQIERSYRLLGKTPLDLIQVHNLRDWKTHLPYLNELKQKGVLKYVGVTHYVDSTHDQLERVIASHPVDFLQVNYNIADRNAERRLLPSAADLGVAVIVNRPFGEGSLFRRVGRSKIPGWAQEIGCSSWAQIFLKFILANPAVTCVIPATTKVNHLEDNMEAGTGALPDQQLRDRMLKAFVAAL
jgi:aryl-alcohol dehydrogenase-like predicted oxidoreductase